MIRINIVVEGHCEEQFVRDVLGEHLALKGIYVSSVESGLPSFTGNGDSINWSIISGVVVGSSENIITLT